MNKRSRFLNSCRWLSAAIATAVVVQPTVITAQQAPGTAPGSLSVTPDQTVKCEILIVGGGLAGSAAAYESLLKGRTVCMTELTDWMGGQISSQGTSALDEAQRQRALLYYPRGYKELRSRIEDYYDELDPGGCWVSATCFLPRDAAEIIREQLEDAEDEGDGELKWFPSTVIKDLQLSADGRLIESAIAIQHQPAPGAPPLNTEPLSAVIEDIYQYQDSSRFTKNIIRFTSPTPDLEEGTEPPVANWYVIEATETGEIVALADVPYRLGLDPRSYLNPSSPVTEPDPYCTQGFTYTFAMERTEDPQPQPEPSFYQQYAPYYSYEKPRETNDYFDYVFTYRRIATPDPDPDEQMFGVVAPSPGDISMQNWTWGNDYRPGTAEDNLVYSRDQLQATGQLEPGGWMGGLRTETLRRGEENAYSYYHWLVAGTTDSQLGDGVKTPNPNHIFLSGFDAPMGTAHGLSKYPYMREGRRIIGRPSYVFPSGFVINEIDISRQDFNSDFYRTNLPEDTYLYMRRALAGLQTTRAIEQSIPPDEIPIRTRSQIYPDAVGIAQYAIDFHPCMEFSPPEAPGNIERTGIRQAHGQAYPGQIPLRAMIPQQIDNLVVASKSIATSTIAAAAYRVHSFEWSVGAAAGTTVDYALEQNVYPYELVDELPLQEPMLEELQRRLEANGNPTAFPNTSVLNEDWAEWRVW